MKSKYYLREKSIANYKHRTCVDSPLGSAALAYMNIVNGQPADPISQEVFEFFFTGENKGKFRRWFNGPRSHRVTKKYTVTQNGRTVTRGGKTPQHCNKADAIGASVYWRNDISDSEIDLK